MSIIFSEDTPIVIEVNQDPFLLRNLLLKEPTVGKVKDSMKAHIGKIRSQDTPQYIPLWSAFSYFQSCSAWALGLPTVWFSGPLTLLL